MKEPSPKFTNREDHGLKVDGNNGSSATIFGEICVPRQIFRRLVRLAVRSVTTVLLGIKASVTAELRTRLTSIDLPICLVPILDELAALRPDLRIMHR